MKQDPVSRFLGGLIAIPFPLFNWIFTCFNFKKWKHTMPEDIQFGLQFGSFLLTAVFVAYYIFLFVFLLRRKEKMIYLLCTGLFAILTASLYFIHCGL